MKRRHVTLKKVLFSLASASIFAAPAAFADCYANYSACLQHPDGMNCEANLNYCLKYAPHGFASSDVKTSDDNSEAPKKVVELPGKALVVTQDNKPTS